MRGGGIRVKRKPQSAIFHATTPAEIGEIEKAETTQIANKKLSGTRLEKRLTTLVCRGIAHILQEVFVKFGLDQDLCASWRKSFRSVEGLLRM